MINAVEEVSNAIQPEADTPIEATKETPEVPEDEPKAAEEKTEDAFPKKAVNAISRRDKMIGKLRAESSAKDARIAELEKKLGVGGPPKEEDFDNYGDYLKESLKHELTPKEEPKAEEKSIYGDVDPIWVQEREESITEKVSEYVKAIPDFQDVLVQSSEILDALPGNIQRLFLEADDGAVAYYNLAKEGKLPSLLSMSEGRAAFVIAQAEAKGISPSKPISKAPAPMTPNKGTVKSVKDAGDMSADELFNIIKRK